MMTEAMSQLVVGNRLRVRTSLDEEFEGEVYAVEESSGSVVFRLPNESSSVSARDANALAGFRIVAQKCLTVVSVLGNNPELSTIKLPKITLSLPKARLEEALAKERKAAARLGVGVTPEAQLIFDGLSKTLPCRWHEQNIIVLDIVMIKPPYTVETSQASDSPGAAEALSRVRKVLGGERRKIFGE